ncbi:MAG: hypothetical protein ACJAQ8_000362 [Haliea salexigens]|jgi:hypothetical protein|tara:strand:- start:1141 stop:1338 length:198 start_codon:yes stop_codon:yes gene_type:complete
MMRPNNPGGHHCYLLAKYVRQNLRLFRLFSAFIKTFFGTISQTFRSVAQHFSKENPETLEISRFS